VNQDDLIIVNRLITNYLTDSLAVRAFQSAPVELFACFQIAAETVKSTCASRWQFALLLSSDAPNILPSLEFGRQIPAKGDVILKDLLERRHLLELLDVVLCSVDDMLAKAIVSVRGCAVDNVNSSDQVLQVEIFIINCSHKFGSSKLNESCELIFISHSVHIRMNLYFGSVQ
jgi:hypothetical protein